MKRLRQVMDIRGIAASDLAAEMGLTRATVDRWRSGRSMASADHAVALARILGVSVEYLLGGDASVPGRVQPHIDALWDEANRMSDGDKKMELAGRLMRLVTVLGGGEP